MTSPTVVSAFVAGLLSFLSPCVLPLVPVYIAQLVGPSVWQAQISAAPAASVTVPRSLVWRAGTLLQALAFVAGFTVVFVALGATASALGALLSTHQEFLRRLGGVALALFGLHVAGILRVPWLDRERRLHLRMGTPGYASSAALGVLFALGWTPCVGPFLSGILVLAAQARTLAGGVGLLAIYSAGLGLPFLLVGAAFDQVAPALRRLSPYLPLIERIAGALLVLLGLAVFFNWLLVVNSWFTIVA